MFETQQSGFFKEKKIICSNISNRLEMYGFNVRRSERKQVFQAVIYR